MLEIEFHGNNFLSNKYRPKYKPVMYMGAVVQQCMIQQALHSRQPRVYIFSLGMFTLQKEKVLVWVK